MVLLFTLAVAGDSIDESDIDQRMLDEEYPQDLDTLEEFIQSYYLLLDSDQELSKYSFINSQHNRIENDSLAMQSFYNKLVELRSGLRDRVSIFQFGDSHIQSGYFAGTARSALQEYFGNAGRGLTFPLRLAGTNQPDDYRVSSSASWSRATGFGLSGYTVRTSSGGSFSLRTNEFFGIANSFDRVGILTNSVDYSWSAGDRNARTQTIAGCENLMRHDLELSRLHSQVELSLQKGQATDALELYGLMLERSEPGLLYNSTGINGASFRSYAANPQFFRQLSATQPDLILISLGTNDAQGNYRAENFRRELRSMLTILRAELPDTPILFSLAPDSNKRRRTNQDISRVNQEIIAWARQNNAAWWNLQEVMGGEGSIRQWKSNALAANDLLHFAPKGYMLQGYLFYQALLKGYQSHTQSPR